MFIEFLSRLLKPFHFRGKARLLHALCPKQGMREATVFGYRMELDLGDWGPRCIYLNVFEPEETALVKRYLKPGMTFVDVGANVGYYTLLAASLVGKEGTVLAFEPSPYVFGKLAGAVERNNLSGQVNIMQAGLSDCAGELELYLPKKPGNHTPTMIPNDGGTPLSVPVYRLDEWLRDQGIERVDMIKMDVEGFEPNVIAGAASYLEQGKVRSIVCEFNRHWLEANGSSAAILYELIVGQGYKSQPEKPELDTGLQSIFFFL